MLGAKNGYNEHTMRFTLEHFKSLCYGMIFTIVTYFIHNPFYDSCSLVGCTSGRGFPLPFSFDKFCASGAANCMEGYFSGATFIFDFIFMALVFWALGRLYRLFLRKEDDAVSYTILK